ncbi:hypothetical protein KSF_046560 [Reticulibacter mediterranei]|uniref:Uncharacterized protein n=1 Tax=Reticulibacter mediterranei TaxID=2778369 RepID=A0A8J3IJ47_9CHLR|nr:hypothetical protein KSF_046560 [Reticulibacter mediterranei]
MYLNDILQVCLLALDSRYPRHKVDINEAVLKRYNVKLQSGITTQGCTVSRIIEIFEKIAPTLLRSPAYLLIDASDCAIYLLEYSGEEPAFYIDCCGTILQPRIVYIPP